MAIRANDDLAKYYDEVPYDSHPFPQSAVEHLATRAFSFGLSAPDPAYARVLELGCAGGGNLIPFAGRYPHATALGIDLSPVQIESGIHAAKRAGLTNIDFRVADLTDIAASLGQFDYIICHGVYSWVPPSAQDAILRICNQNLAPDGVAYISYNVYPGWKTREIARDAMLLRASSGTDPAGRLSLGMGMLATLLETSESGSVMRTVIEDVKPLVRTADPAYISHEFLEPFNAPCYFTDLLARASAHGLAYLAEAASSSMFAENYPDAIRDFLLRECGGSQVVMEQYIDFFTNRSFRQTLFVKEARAGQIDFSLDPARVASMFFAGFYATLDGSLLSLDDREQLCSAPCHRSILLSSAVHKAVVQVLDGRFPACMSVDEIVSHIAGQLDRSAVEVRPMALALLERLVRRGAVYSRRERADIAADLQQLPRALEANCRASNSFSHNDRPRLACNQWHERVTLSSLEAFLLALTDGSRSHDELEIEVAAATRAGDLKFTFRNESVDGAALPAGFIRTELLLALDAMQRKGLFVA
ncbi:methyltransferase regulatory domain-containing protein [Variovorax sp. RHLX14]|uniref:methyltransferase regulatory domain-containing protein n=1 Tax=Variovorax sp. RHLX14 TaxID=1259731 RepID=UPI003F44E820